MTERKQKEIFQPLEVDEQIDKYLTSSSPNVQPLDTSTQTVQALQRYFAPTEQDAALQRVWQRFAQEHATQNFHKQEYVVAPIEQKKKYRVPQGTYSARPVRSGLWSNRLGQIAALIFVTLLVGSMVFVFQQISNRRSVVSSAPQHISNATNAPKERMMFAILPNGTLYRLDIKTHQPIWHFQVHSGSISSGEQVVGTTCYIAGEIGNQGKLYALDVASGKVRWQVDLSSPLIGYPLTSLVVSNDTLYLPLTKNGSPIVEAIAVSNGARKWEHTLEGSQPQLLTASNQAVYGQMGQGGARFALSARDGHSLWQKNEEIANLDAIDRGFVVDGVLSVVKSNGSGLVVGYNAANGNQLWSHPLDGRLSGYGTTLLNGVVYVSTNRQPNQADTIYAFSAKNGTQIWRYQDSTTTGSSYPMVTEQVVYFYRYNNGHNGQTLVALNTADGKERWTYDFHDGTTVEFAPTADNSQVYLSLPDNTIQIVQATDGKPLGSFKTPGRVDPNNRVLLLVVEG